MRNRYVGTRSESEDSSLNNHYLCALLIYRRKKHMNSYYKTLLKLADKAKKKNCVPVSAIIVKNNNIVSIAYNKRKITNNVLDHAEIIAIKKASKKLKNWNLSKCELYVTMKPCKMCEVIINESRIKKIHYILDNYDYEKRKEKERNEIEYIKEDDINNEYYFLLKNFFKNLREKE